MRRLRVSACLAAVALLAGCDMLGIESASAVAAQREAEGKAVGGACRHAGRAIEDCYALNRKAEKAAVFAGWREMNDYMRENKIDPVSPQLTPPTEVAKASPAEVAVEEAPKKLTSRKAAKSGKPADEVEDAEKPAESTRHAS